MNKLCVSVDVGVAGLTACISELCILPQLKLKPLVLCQASGSEPEETLLSSQVMLDSGGNVSYSIQTQTAGNHQTQHTKPDEVRCESVRRGNTPHRPANTTKTRRESRYGVETIIKQNNMSTQCLVQI